MLTGQRSLQEWTQHIRLQTGLFAVCCPLPSPVFSLSVRLQVVFISIKSIFLDLLNTKRGEVCVWGGERRTLLSIKLLRPLEYANVSTTCRCSRGNTGNLYDRNIEDNRSINSVKSQVLKYFGDIKCHNSLFGTAVEGIISGRQFGDRLKKVAGCTLKIH